MPASSAGEPECLILVHAKSINTMKIQKIIGERGEQPQLCNGGGCPATILTEGDNVVIQGYTLSAADRADLSDPKGEDFVKMPRAVFEKIARHVLSA
jgi:hypothetical protein